MAGKKRKNSVDLMQLYRRFTGLLYASCAAVKKSRAIWQIQVFYIVLFGLAMWGICAAVSGGDGNRGWKIPLFYASSLAAMAVCCFFQCSFMQMALEKTFFRSNLKWTMARSANILLSGFFIYFILTPLFLVMPLVQAAANDFYVISAIQIILLVTTFAAGIACSLLFAAVAVNAPKCKFAAILADAWSNARRNWAVIVMLWALCCAFYLVLLAGSMVFGQTLKFNETLHSSVKYAHWVVFVLASLLFVAPVTSVFPVLAAKTAKER